MPFPLHTYVDKIESTLKFKNSTVDGPLSLVHALNWTQELPLLSTVRVLARVRSSKHIHTMRCVADRRIRGCIEDIPASTDCMQLRCP